MRTYQINITVPDAQIANLELMLKQFEATTDGMLTLAEACREFGISSSTMNRWVNMAKVIPASQPMKNGKKFVKRSDVLRLLAGKQEEVEKPKRRKTILSPGIRMNRKRSREV
jgi:hypothetical protein